MIDTWIKYLVRLHYVLHGFHSWRDTGTAIMELKLAQVLESVYHYSLLLVSLYLSKAYDNQDRGILLQTLEGYGLGPKLRILLAEFWSGKKVVTR